MDEIPGVGGREETYSPSLSAMMGVDATWDADDVKSFADKLALEEDSEGKVDSLVLKAFKNHSFLILLLFIQPFQRYKTMVLNLQCHFERTV
jgi:hypothetical protein